MKQFQHTIRDPLGIHARPAGLLVKEASRYKSAVSVDRDEKSADAKKIFSLMGLAAGCGDTVTVTVRGEDEQDAALALEQFMKEIW